MGYYEMIKEAILALKDRTGSSSMAIKKVRHQSSYSSSCALGKPLFWPDPISSPRPAPPNQQFIESAHPEIKFAQHSLRAALKMGVEKGKLVMVKASYKLSPDEKKPPKKKKVSVWV